MKKMKYGIAVTCLTVGMMLAITACGGKKAESTETAAQTAVVVETQTETETETAQESELTLADGQMFSYLTGEPVDKKIAETLCDHDQQYQRGTSSVRCQSGRDDL